MVRLVAIPALKGAGEAVQRAVARPEALLVAEEDFGDPGKDAGRATCLQLARRDLFQVWADLPFHHHLGVPGTHHLAPAAGPRARGPIRPRREPAERRAVLHLAEDLHDCFVVVFFVISMCCKTMCYYVLCVCVDLVYHLLLVCLLHLAEDLLVGDGAGPA